MLNYVGYRRGAKPGDAPSRTETFEETETYVWNTVPATPKEEAINFSMAFVFRLRLSNY